MSGLRKAYLAVAGFVFLATLTVYTLTVTNSIPFWDSGEFIAASHILGIPHPPGTPLYVIIGRLFAMLPFGNVYLQVNWLSALASALAVLFTFLVTVRLMRLAQTRSHLDRERTPSEEVIAWAAGAAAAFFVAFSSTFWDSAIEAEVYSLSSFVQILAVYLALRWWEELGENGGDGKLLLTWYLMCLCIGIHLGTFLVAPAVVVLALLVNPRSVFHPRFLLWAAIAVLIGISVHFYLMIRAHLNPSINEGDPESWDAMMYLLQRKQYGSRPPFPRSAPWDFQLGMYWRYFMDQYRLWPLQGQIASVLPLALGLYGAFMQGVREKKTFLMMLVLYGITGFGLIVYLNFTDHEVRERDYFFTSSFHFFAIWIGMGIGFVLELVKDALGDREGGRVTPALAAACVLAVGVSWLPAKSNWFEHDRTDFFIARDYAYNMLVPLDKKSFVFTNGDNDTFPLWCLQEVERTRNDVRVVNLSLLNTDWYIKQLRDEEPKVPMTVSDAVLEQVKTQGYLFDEQGQPEQVSTWMVRNILTANARAGEGRKTAYLAVTVPNHMGLDPFLSLEGLVYRVQGDSVASRVDTAATRRNLYDVFLYRGLFDRDGTYIPKPYKDDNAWRLSQNYAAAHLQLGFRYRQDRNYDAAIAEMQRIVRMFPEFPAARPALAMFYLEKGDTAASLRSFEESAKVTPNDADLAYYHGIVLLGAGRPQDAVVRFRDAMRLDPEDPQAYYATYSVYLETGQRQEAAGVLREWLGRHPDDTRVQQMLQQLEGGPTSSLAPPGGPGGVGAGGAPVPGTP